MDKQTLTALVAAAEAQARATWHLAEQQRIANMIAIAELHGSGSEARELVTDYGTSEFSGPEIPEELHTLLTTPLV